MNSISHEEDGEPLEDAHSDDTGESDPIRSEGIQELSEDDMNTELVGTPEVDSTVMIDYP